VINIIKKRIINIFDLLGYTLVKKQYNEPIDLRNKSNNPKSLHYHTNTNRQIVISTTLDKGRGLEIFSLGNNSSHPYIKAIKYAIQKKDYKAAIKESLYNYYASVQPKNSAQWLGLEKGEAPKLDIEEPWVSLLPWESASMVQKKDGRKECALHDNNEHGIKLDIKQGWRNFGPVSEAILNIEVERLYKLIISIQKNGILRDNKEGGDIGAVVLVKEDFDYRWLVEWGGQHRAATLSAMGYDNIDIRVWQVVERSDVELWSNVQSGIYSKEMALKVFDSIYSGIGYKGLNNND
jgi:hypothetical protein